MYFFLLILVLLLAGSVKAHVGDRIFPIPEIPDEALDELDVRDRSLEDWEAVGLYPVLTATDFFASQTIGEGAPYSPDDLDYRIWLGWNGSTSRLYFAMERSDNIFVNEYAGGNPDDMWRHDGAFWFMVDGDHTGGDYTEYANPAWTEEERILNNNRSAQCYFGITDAPDGQHIGYLGAGSQWVTFLPYANGGGGTIGETPGVSIIECYVTAFDDLIWNDPEASKPSELYPGKTIGFAIDITDFDTEPGRYHAFHSVGRLGSRATADHFVDGLLVGVQGETHVEDVTWARIKASFQTK